MGINPPGQSTFLVKWWPTVITVLAAIVAAATPEIQGVIAAHPTLSTVLIGVWAVVAHLVPSPVQK